eukprot:XP_008666217.1 vegetative cell wall protein gp1-like [Zea mays]
MAAFVAVRWLRRKATVKRRETIAAGVWGQWYSGGRRAESTVGSGAEVKLAGPSSDFGPCVHTHFGARFCRSRAADPHPPSLSPPSTATPASWSSTPRTTSPTPPCPVPPSVSALGSAVGLLPSSVSALGALTTSPSASAPPPQPPTTTEAADAAPGHSGGGWTRPLASASAGVAPRLQWRRTRPTPPPPLPPPRRRGYPLRPGSTPMMTMTTAPSASSAARTHR